jgi:hypothetical protein
MTLSIKVLEGTTFNFSMPIVKNSARNKNIMTLKNKVE